MNNTLKTASVLAMIAGILMVIAGAWGIIFTYQNVTREKITTSADASIPNAKVAGPFTLKAQADVIRKHTLESTGGKTYAEMPRQIQQVDSRGNPVFDSEGQPVMVANSARDIWITATSLTTALHLGIITYAFSALVLLLGLISIWTSITFRSIGHSN